MFILVDEFSLKIRVFVNIELLSKKRWKWYFGFDYNWLVYISVFWILFFLCFVRVLILVFVIDEINFEC